jgi:hypothetical protein
MTEFLWLSTALTATHNGDPHYESDKLPSDFIVYAKYSYDPVEIDLILQVRQTGRQKEPLWQEEKLLC